MYSNHRLSLCCPVDFTFCQVRNSHQLLSVTARRTDIFDRFGKGSASTPGLYSYKPRKNNTEWRHRARILSAVGCIVQPTLRPCKQAKARHAVGSRDGNGCSEHAELRIVCHRPPTTGKPPFAAALMTHRRQKMISRRRLTIDRRRFIRQM